MSHAHRQDVDPAVAPTSIASAPTQPPRFSLRNRYSRFVGWMKVLLPALAVALVLTPARRHLRIPADRDAEVQVKDPEGNMLVLSERGWDQ